MGKNGKKAQDVVEEEEGLGFTKEGKPRKRRPGQGRKHKDAFRQGQQIMVEAHPEVSKHIVAKALGSETKVVCPECRHRFKIRPLGAGDKEMLVHIDNRVQGKPTQVSVMDVHNRLELDVSQLAGLFDMLMEFKKGEGESLTLEIVEAEFKEMPAPDLSELRKEEERARAMPMLVGAGVSAGSNDTGNIPSPIQQHAGEYVEFSLPEDEEIKKVEKELEDKKPE